MTDVANGLADYPVDTSDQGDPATSNDVLLAVSGDQPIAVTLHGGEPDGTALRADLFEIEQAPDIAWRSYLARHDIVAAIVALDMGSPFHCRHAYLIGFDTVRGASGLTQALLRFADDVWTQLGDEPHGEVVLPAIDANAVSSRPGLDLAECSAVLKAFGPTLAIQGQSRGVGVRGIFFRAARANAAPERRDVAELLPLLVEHGLARAGLQRQSRQTAMLEAMFDCVSLPMMLLDADCRPMFANASAEAILRERKWLQRQPHGGALACAGVAETRALRAAVRQVASAGGSPCQRFLRLEDPAGEWRLVQVVTPSGRATPFAMVVVLSPDRVTASPHLLEALGLLPSEQRFVRQFLQSSNINAAAVDCGISEETARTYLKRVRSKLGVSRQMDLASLISSLALPLRDSAALQG